MRGKKLQLNNILKNVLIASFFAFIFIGISIKSAPKAEASFLERIPFSATLLDSGGIAVPDTSYDIIVRFYSASTGGSPLWEETQSVTTDKGKFEILLGSVATLTALNLDQTIYVTVQVGNDSEMSPRKQVGATPQALMAKKATSLVAPEGGEIEAIGGLHVSLGLHIEGDATFDGKLVFGNGAEISQDGLNLSFAQSLLPSTTGLDLGSLTQRWSTIFSATTNSTVLALKESTAPDTLAGYGQLYTGEDGALHFKNSSGATITITEGATSFEIQELVKDFTAALGENISAGNLVSYFKDTDGNNRVRKGASQNIASSSAFEAATTANISAVVLSSNKIAVSYSDLGNTNKGTTIIGTITGSSVVWGAPSIFEADSTYTAAPGTPINISMVALSSDKIAVSYTDTGNSSFGTTIVGTVTDTSISWGSPSVFESASTNYISAASLSSDKIVISYSDVGNSNFGTTIHGTVSGTDIVWGTASVFESASTSFISMLPVSTNKVAISYSDLGNGNFGTTIVGTIVGSVFSWGTAVVFESASTSNISSTVLSSDKIAVSYSDMDNFAHGTANIGTISGTVITFGTPSVFEFASTFEVASTYITNSSIVALSSDKIIVNYQDVGNVKNGTTVIGNIAGAAISWGTPIVFRNDTVDFISAVVLSPDKIALTYQDYYNSRYGTFKVSNMDPYLGVSKDACVAGAVCTIATKGIVSGLVGLTAGATYYAGANGVLTTTPYPNRVGTAVSTTEIALDSKWGSGGAAVSDLIFRNSFRMTEFQNSAGQQGLAMYDQNTKPILQLTDTGGLSVSGSVGVGMTTPTAKLHITSSAGTVGIELSSNETTAGSNIMVLRSDNITDDNAVFRVQADGAVYADGAYTGTGADYAEYFANEELIPEESLVGLNKATGKVRKYIAGDKLIGVVSANAGFIGNSSTLIENDPAYTLVGLMGQLEITPSEIKVVDGSVYTLDGIQVGHNLLGGKVLIDIIAPDNRINKLLLAFDKDGALVLGAGSRLYSKTDGLATFEGSLEILKNLYVKGKFITPSGDIQYLTADANIEPVSAKIKISGKDSAVILAGEQIKPGEDGQNIIIQGSDDANTVTFQSPLVSPASKVKIGAETRILGKGDILTLTYDSNDGFWYESSFANN